MKLFTSEGELLSFNKLYEEDLGMIQVSSQDCYIAENINESVSILLQEVRRPGYELYFVMIDVDQEQEFSSESDQPGKCLCYSFMQHIQVEFDRGAIITIPEQRFNVLPLAPCNIRVPKGRSAYLLIRIPPEANLFNVRFKLPYFYPKDHNPVYWDVNSYRGDAITRGLGSYMFKSFRDREGLRRLDRGIQTIIVSSLAHIVSTGLDREN